MMPERSESHPALTPQHAGKHDPEKSGNKPDNAEQKRELDRRRKRIGEKKISRRDVKGADQEIEHESLSIPSN